MGNYDLHGDFPLVTVIMPIRNEGPFIKKSLAAVLAQEYPPDLMQVLVVDGMSRDDTRELVQAIADSDARVCLLDNPGHIVPTGMNIGISQAKGDIIVRVDGHTIIAPDYVLQCVIALRRSSAENVGGRMNARGSAPFGQAVALATSVPFGVGGARFHYSQDEEWVDTVYMGAWPKQVFARFGLFDEEMVRNQDDEFNYRLRAGGGKILLSPAIRSEYFNRSSPTALWKQYFEYGFWKVRVLQKHTTKMRPRQFAPAAFVVGMLFLLVLAVMGSGYALLLPAMLLAYPGAAALVAFSRRNQGEKGLADRLVIAFLILHVAYGAGFLIGFLKFMPRWLSQPNRSRAQEALRPSLGDRVDRTVPG